MATYDRVVPGGSRAVVEAITDTVARAYLSKPILAATWYDLFSHALLDIAAADLLKIPAWESVAAASALQAEDDAAGIYSLLLRFVTPQTLIRKLGRVTAQYFDHGSVDVEKVGDKSARLTRHGIANQLYWWWDGILEGYVRALFGIAGAKNVVIRCGLLSSDAPDDPLGLGSFTVDVSWE